MYPLCQTEPCHWIVPRRRPQQHFVRPSGLADRDPQPAAAQQVRQGVVAQHVGLQRASGMPTCSPGRIIGVSVAVRLRASVRSALCPRRCAAGSARRSPAASRRASAPVDDGMPLHPSGAALLRSVPYPMKPASTGIDIWFPGPWPRRSIDGPIMTCLISARLLLGRMAVDGTMRKQGAFGALVAHRSRFWQASCVHRCDTPTPGSVEKSTPVMTG